MISKYIAYDPSEILTLWQMIIWRMEVHRITPNKLAELTSYSLAMILKGVRGEAALITDPFLQKCVVAFGLVEGRINSSDNTHVANQFTRQQCIEILKPQPAMPPNEKHFWENDEYQG
jgi:hypothetical protein